MFASSVSLFPDDADSTNTYLAVWQTATTIEYEYLGKYVYLSEIVFLIFRGGA